MRQMLRIEISQCGNYIEIWIFEELIARYEIIHDFCELVQKQVEKN